MICAQANHEPVMPNLFDMKPFIFDRRGDQRRVDVARDDFLHKVHGIAFHGKNLAIAHHFSVRLAGDVREFLVYTGPATEAQRLNFAMVDSDQSGKCIVAGVEHILSNHLEGLACLGDFDSPTAQSPVQLDARRFLELPGLRTEIRLYGVQGFSGSAKALLPMSASAKPGHRAPRERSFAAE